MLFELDEDELDFGQLAPETPWQLVAAWAWEQVNGPVPANCHLIKTCPTKKCVRPSHYKLQPMTATELRKAEKWKRTR